MARAARRTGRGALTLLLSIGMLLLAACGQLPTRTEPTSRETLHTARLDIVISDDLPAYEGVAAALVKRLTPAPRLHRLNGRVEDQHGTIATLQNGGDVPIVAIGPEAVQLAARVPTRPMVYCQVYHYDIPPSAHSGVKAMPPVAKQFRAWKLVDPRLQRVVLLTGPGFERLAAEAQAAAKDAQLKLEHVVARSDKELLYAVKRLDATVQGVWLAPDRRVLSAEVLREVLSHSVRNGKSVLAFSPKLLPYGALLSVEGEHNDVADRVMAQLRQLDDGRRPGSALGLTRARVEINPLVARHLGLTVPPALQGGTHVF